MIIHPPVIFCPLTKQALLSWWYMQVYGNPRSSYHQYFPPYLGAPPAHTEGSGGAPPPERSTQFNTYLPYFHAQKQHQEQLQQQQQQQQQQQHCQVNLQLIAYRQYL